MGGINLSIDDHEVTVPQDSTILRAAEKVGVKIPTLCHFEGLTPSSSCRFCVVEIEGVRNLVAACSHPVTPGHQG